MRLYHLCIAAWFSGLSLSGATGNSALKADVVDFGTGSNSFSLTFEAVENPSNSADTNDWGAVGYSFGMSRYEISEGMIDAYNAHSENSAFPIFYDSTPRGADKPATSITWNEAARFVNWLNTSKGYSAAYLFPGPNNSNISSWTEDHPDDWNPLNPYRSKRAVYVLPTLDEWYKAAYYDPALNDGDGGYWKYAVKTNTDPTPVTGGTGQDEVVYGNGVSGSPADITNAGGLSAYGVMAMNGNVWEWTETPEGDGYYTGSSQRGFVGGSWADMTADSFDSSQVLFKRPNVSYLQAGFRVVSLLDFNGGGDFSGGGDSFGGGDFGGAGDGGFSGLSSTVPEPGSLLFVCGSAALALRRRWKGRRPVPSIRAAVSRL